MARALKITGVGLVALLAVLVALVLLAAFVLPKTGPGKGLIDGIARPIIEEQVRAQLGSEIEFDRIEGALPGELILTDIALSEGGSPWLTVERVRLDWSPTALIRRQIVVDSLVATRVDLLRQPPPFPEKEPQPEEESGPLNLPSIHVGRVAIEPLTLHEPVLGTEYSIDLEAGLDALGQDVAAEARVATASGSDTVQLSVDYDPRTLTAKVTVEGAEDGLIAELSRAGGPVSVSIDGDGALADWRGTLAAAFGEYGDADATLSGDLSGFSNARFAGTVRPGRGLPEVASQVVGEALEIDVATTRDGDALLVAIEQLDGRFGRLGGTVRLSSPSAEAVTANLAGMLSEPVATEFGVPFLAGPLGLTAEAAQADGVWQADARLDTEAFTATVTDGRAGGETTFAGTVGVTSRGLTIGQERIDPILQGGAEVRAVVDYPAQGPVRVTDIDARLGTDALAINAQGSAQYDLETQAFRADLDARARRAALETLAGTGSYEGPLDPSIEASGTPQDARVRIDGQLPAGSIEGVAFSRGTLDANLAGLPARPAGELRLTSEGGEYGGRVVARSQGAVVSIPTLNFSSNGLTLDGEGTVNTETRAVDARLVLDASDGATLVTGQTVGGRAIVSADIAENGGPIDVSVSANELTFEGNRIESAEIDAKGPLDAVAFSVDATGIAAADQFVPFLRTAGQADVATPQRVIRLDRLATAYGSDAPEDRVTLLAPTTVELGEVIAVSETRLDWLGDGTLTAEGRYAADLWVANVTARELTLPGQPVAADLDLAVDSREDAVATFDLTARTTGEDQDQALFARAQGRWSGDRLAADLELAPEGGETLGSARVAFPLVLTRTEGTLGVELPEEGLDGRIVYASELEPLYAFAQLDEPPLTGRLDADVALSGAVTAPEARGEVRLSDGRVEEDQFGFLLQDIGVVADFSYTGTETVAEVRGSATDADGREDAVLITGDVRIGAEGASAVDVQVALDDAQLSDSAALELQTSAELALTGPLTDLLFAGRIQIDELDAQIPSIEGGEGAPEYVAVNVVRTDAPAEDRVGELAEPAPPPFSIALDLSIEANNAVYVRGRGLDSEWRIDLTVDGTTIEPIIGGEIALLDGTFDFAGRTFDLARGNVAFQRGTEIDPRLDVRAEYDAGDVTAILGVTGTATDPQIELSANPPRPQEDVLALILFGKQPTELTAIESLQIANAVATLTGASPFGGGGPGIQDKLRSGLGLDSLSLGLGDDGSATVGVGKYVTDDVYVSARQSAGDLGTEVTVTYEVTDDVTVESVLRPDGAQGVRANYKRDY